MVAHRDIGSVLRSRPKERCPLKLRGESVALQNIARLWEKRIRLYMALRRTHSTRSAQGNENAKQDQIFRCITASSVAMRRKVAL